MKDIKVKNNLSTRFKSSTEKYFKKFKWYNVTIIILLIVGGSYLYYLFTYSLPLNSLFSIIGALSFLSGLFILYYILKYGYEKKYLKIINYGKKLFEYIIEFFVAFILLALFTGALQISPSLLSNPVNTASNTYMVIYNIVFVSLTASGIILGFALLGIVEIIRKGANMDKNTMPMYDRILSIAESFVSVIASGLILLFVSSTNNPNIFIIPTLLIQFTAIMLLFIFLIGGFMSLIKIITLIRKTWKIEAN